MKVMTSQRSMHASRLIFMEGHQALGIINGLLHEGMLECLTKKEQLLQGTKDEKWNKAVPVRSPINALRCSCYALDPRKSGWYLHAQENLGRVLVKE